MNFLRFLPSAWTLNVATLGPVGRLKKMPGTYGSFVGLIYYTLFFHELTPAEYFFACIVSFWIACIFCEEAELILGKKDPACVVLDEMIALPFCFMGLQKAMTHYPVWLFMLLGFVFFRFFDILKPFGIKQLQALNGGLGIVLDDVVAGLFVCLILHIIFYGILPVF